MSIWQHEVDLAQLNRWTEGTLDAHLGLCFTEIGPDYLRATLPVDARTRQPFGLLHGGASMVLAESLGSTGANLCVNQQTHYCVGLEINANHLRSARQGAVTGTTRPVHIGRRTQVWSIEIANERAELVCLARLTMAVLERRAGI